MTLRLNSTGGGFVEIDAPNTASNFSVTMPATAGEIVVANTSGDVDLGGLTVSGSAGDDSVNVDSSGRLLVGTSSAGTGAFSSSLFVVQGVAGFSNVAGFMNLQRGEAATSITANEELGVIAFTDDAANAFAKIQGVADASAGSNDYPGRLVFSTTADGASSPTERMRIAQNGLVSIPGVYSFTTVAAANVYVESAGQLSRATSSSKYKTNVETIEDVYADALLDCRPVWYRSTCANDNPGWGWWGFIAEEVAEIDPRLVHWKTTEVTYDEKGSVVETPCNPEPEGVMYDRFVPHLLNLIKRQQHAIETLEAKVAALEAA